MPRPLAHLSNDELREQLWALKTSPNWLKPTRLVGMGAVLEWALEFGVFPGRTRAIEAVDLYRHFFEAGYRLAGHAPIFWEFGSCLTQLGLTKGRDGRNGVSKRPRLMAQDAAEYFQAWLLEHPRPVDTERFGLEGAYASP